MATKFYREVEFCYESLGITYTEFRNLPRWERVLINCYLDVKQIKQQQEDDYWEQRKHKEGWSKERGTWILNI